jgi:hypothetical protein
MAKKEEKKKEEQVVIPPVQLALLRAEIKEELRDEFTANLAANPDNEIRLTDEELATELVSVMSKELHLRAGIGPIWRQLNPTRKSEIMEKWTADVELILGDSR